MLLFYRPGWSGGYLSIKDRHEDGTEFRRMLRASLNNTVIEFEDPAFVIDKYPAWVSEPAPVA